MNYESRSARAVDLGTTLRIAPRVHSSSKNRPERNKNCVTHVVGLKCYLCCRLLNQSREARLRRVRGLSPRREPLIRRGLHPRHLLPQGKKEESKARLL